MSEDRQPTRQQRWRARNPIADWAHSATRSAIRRGLLQRQDCAVCGDPDTDAHHPDHSNPLNVIFLCRRHHKDLHKRLAEVSR
jgi:hypothetical protein